MIRVVIAAAGALFALVILAVLGALLWYWATREPEGFADRSRRDTGEDA